MRNFTRNLGFNYFISLIIIGGIICPLLPNRIGDYLFGFSSNLIILCIGLLFGLISFNIDIKVDGNSQVDYFLLVMAVHVIAPIADLICSIWHSKGPLGVFTEDISNVIRDIRGLKPVVLKPLEPIYFWFPTTIVCVLFVITAPFRRLNRIEKILNEKKFEQ